MSQLFEKCKRCVDSVYISWDRTKLSTKEKRTIEECEVWGITKLALYILNNKEYNQLKQYILDALIFIVLIMILIFAVIGGANVIANFTN